jgi:hypothetical protein
MTITNKHVGWSIVLLITLTPWVFLLTGTSGVQADGDINFLGVLIVLETLVAAVLTVGGIIHTLCRLLDEDHFDPIEFEWTIRLPQRHEKPKIKEKLIRFGQLSKDDPEYDELYSELKSKGVFG